MATFETYKTRILELYGSIDCIENEILDKINNVTSIEEMFVLLTERSKTIDGIDKSVSLYLLSDHYKKVGDSNSQLKFLKLSADLKLKEAMVDYSIASDDISYAIEASKMGFSDATNLVGLHYFNNKNIKKMMEYYNLAIEQGNVLAINNFGKYYELIEDFPKAKELYQRAILLNNSTAKLNYARLLYSPFNEKFKIPNSYTKEDFDECIKLLEESVEQNNIYASVDLIVIYSNTSLHRNLTPKEVEAKLIIFCLKFVNIYEKYPENFESKLSEIYANTIGKLAHHYKNINRELCFKYYNKSIELNDALSIQKFADIITFEEMEKYYVLSGIEDNNAVCNKINTEKIVNENNDVSKIVNENNDVSKIVNENNDVSKIVNDDENFIIIDRNGNSDKNIVISDNDTKNIVTNDSDKNNDKNIVTENNDKNIVTENNDKNIVANDNDKNIVVNENVCLFIALFYNINEGGKNGRNGITRNEMIYKYLIPASNTNCHAQYFLGKMYKNEGKIKEMLSIYNKNYNNYHIIADELALYYKEKGNENRYKYFADISKKLKQA